MIRFTHEDKARITAAIHAAEKSTSGEFVAVVARASEHYVALPLLWSAILALLLPGACLLAGVSLRWVHLYQIQLLVFIVLTVLLLSVPGLHLMLVPRHVKRAHAARLAKSQFYAQGVQLTPHHSGVLLFVSLAERYVEIVADKGIHERIGEARWKAIIDGFVGQVRRGRVADGFVEAIGACGAAMAEHYPPDPSEINELSDGLVEL
ncbi:MAG TPA: TPM domain-containing protein [Steroidobacteraceae bacterium]|nr:TPM domain-containing protein [Steroidobacteraceae bacterium]